MTPVVIDDFDVWAAENLTGKRRSSGETPKSVVLAPLFAAASRSAVSRSQNIDRTHAFSESDVRLMTTLASSLSVALENARLVAETAAAGGGAGDDQRGRPGSGVTARPRSADRAGGRPDGRRRSKPTSSTSLSTTRPLGLIEFPYHIENGRMSSRRRSPRRGPDVADHPVTPAACCSTGRRTWTEMSNAGRRH